MITQAQAQVRVRMYGVAIALAGELLAGASATAATLYVGSGGGDYANLAAAVTAATAGDTITIRAGYSTAGASVTIPNLTIRGENYYSTNANNPSNLYQLNPARSDINESVVTSPITLQTQSSGNPDGTQILGLFFNITSGSGSAVNFNSSGGRAVKDVVVSNNRFRATTTSVNAWVGAGGSIHSGSYGWADGILIENNRMGDMFINNGSAMFPTGKNWTIKGNYINHDADGLRSGQLGWTPSNATLENGRRGFNINGVPSNPTENIVVVGNVFQGLGGVNGNSWCLQPNGNVSNLVMANNKFDGNARDIVTYAPGANQLISGNESRNLRIGTTGTGGISIDYQFGSTSNMVVRQNYIEVDVTADRALSGLRILPNSTATGSGMLVENNAFSLTGTAGTNTQARAAVALGYTSSAGYDRFDLLGPLNIRNNVIQDTGVTGIDSVGIFYSTMPGRTLAGMNLNVANNEINGLDYGAYVSSNLTATSPGSLPVGDSALVQSDNILNNGVGVSGGTGGAGIGIAGSYFSGNTTNTSGNTYGAAGGSANAVAGRDANYVTFRGDHNLSNAVDAADAALIVSNFGARGPGVTYYRGDSTLDQEVTLADGKVFARFVHDPIGASGTITDPASVGAPTVTYDPLTGNVTFTAGAQGSIWGLSLKDGLTVLTPGATTPANLGAGFLYGDVTSGIEFYNSSFGSTGAFATGSNVLFATLATGLTAPAFGQVEYYFGQDAQVSSKLTPITFLPIPEPTGLVMLALGAWGLVARRQRGR